MPDEPTPSMQATGDQLGQELSLAVVLYHQAIADRLGLGTADWKCLDVLLKSGPVSAGQLAELTGLSTGAITGIVDRLEHAGHVRRERDPADRRRVIIQPVPQPELAREVTRIFESLGQAMSWVSERYSDEQLAVIAGFLQSTIATLRAETTRLRDDAG
jgi:DNA-binding MarR family transcriptional regulator